MIGNKTEEDKFEHIYDQERSRKSGLFADDFGSDDPSRLVVTSFMLTQRLQKRIKNYVNQKADDGEAADDIVEALLSDALRERGY